MNLQEIAAKLPVRGLRARLLQQEKRIQQLEEENQWLKEQLNKAVAENTLGDRRRHQK